MKSASSWHYSNIYQLQKGEIWVLQISQAKNNYHTGMHVFLTTHELEEYIETHGEKWKVWTLNIAKRH